MFGLTWVPRAVSYGAWAHWAEIPGLTARVDALREMFVDPDWERFVSTTPVREFETNIIQLWGAVRLPPDSGNG